MPRAFQYVGKDESSPDQVTVRGLTFERDGEAVTVLDEALANGLSGNPEFEEVGGPDYGDVPFDPDPEELVTHLNARVSELEATNELLVSENQELRERLGEATPTPVADPVTPPDYQENDPTEDVFAEIDASEDWSKEHHSKRRRWANTLTEGQIATTEEADEVILNALVEREQDQD